MSATLDDQVRLMEASWFMSYPHDVYARLRREAPVYWSERDGLWAISKYDDVRSVSKTPARFGSAYHIYVAAAGVQDDGEPSTDPRGLPRRAELRKIEALGPLHTDNLVMADGERHTFLRKIASHAFTPRAIGELEDQVKRIAADLFDQIPDEVEVDFVDTVAAPLPMIMIALMLGVPIEDLDTFRVWSDAFIEMSGRVGDGSGGGPHQRDHRSSASTSPSSCRTASPTRVTTCSPSSPRPSGTASRSASTSSSPPRRSC